MKLIDTIKEKLKKRTCGLDYREWAIVEKLYSYDDHIMKHHLEMGLSVGQIIGRKFAQEYSNFVFKAHADHLFIDQTPHIGGIIKEIEYNQITDISYNVVDNKVHITLVRPGVFIGVRGSYFAKVDTHFENWCKKLGIKYAGIKLIEDRYSLKNDLQQSVYMYELGRRY